MLNPATLSSALLAAWSAYPATVDQAAEGWAAAYDDYASVAQACNALGPTQVNLTGLEDGLKSALNAGGDYASVADAVASAHEDYWTGALFGATGAVTTVGGTAALKSGLEALWQAQSAALATFADSATAHAALFDVFTKTVQVKDTAVPPPSGCGPAPIT